MRSVDTAIRIRARSRATRQERQSGAALVAINFGKWATQTREDIHEPVEWWLFVRRGDLQL